MKKLVLVAAASLIAVGAFAQGKVSAVNGAGRELTWAASTAFLKPAEQAMAGQFIGTSYSFKYEVLAAPGDMNVAALAPVGTMQTLGMIAPGRMPAYNVLLPSTPAFPGGTRATFQLRFWESSFANYAAASQGGGYVGSTVPFTQVPNNITYTPLSGSGTTWATGPIYMAVVPEPASADRKSVV